ncbi:hypothetical protein Adi01nite_51450 [Amorphoplanes digitatis]|nr:hypothetical protein Adi01nite_51450 [Actinoplanes digitatis]
MTSIIHRSRSALSRRVTRRRTFALALLTTVSIVIGTGASGSAALANAENVATWGWLCLGGKCVPEGALYQNVSGSRLRVDYTKSYFRAYKSVCFWHMDQDFYKWSDNKLVRFTHAQGPDHNRCNTSGGVDTGSISFPTSGGKICTSLYEDHVKLKARTCINVYG